MNSKIKLELYDGISAVATDTIVTTFGKWCHNSFAIKSEKCELTKHVDVLGVPDLVSQ